MAKATCKSVDEYIASQPTAVQRLLKRVRSTISKAVPAADDTISYGIPTFKLQGRPMLYFAAWKAHYSLCPSGDRLVAQFRKELAPYEVEKGTIRLPLTGSVPVDLIAAIAKFRAGEITGAAGKTKPATPKKR